MIRLLIGYQNDFKKFYRFLCLWGSRATKRRYQVKEWLSRDQQNPDQANMKNIVLVDAKKVLLPSSHITLELMK